VPTPSTSLAPPSWREWLLVIFFGVAITTFITWPMVPHLGSVGRLDSGDGRLSIWNIGWVDHAILTDPAHLLDANIFWPHRGTLAYSEMNLVAGVLGLPAYAFTHNAVAAHNLAVLTALLLSMICTWLLVRRLTQSSGAGFVSAILFTFCSYMQGHTAHVQLLMIFVVPLVMLAFHWLRERPTAWRSMLLGGALATAGLACGYYGIYGGLLLGFAAVVFAKKDWRYWLALVGAAATAVVLVVPFVLPYQRAREATGAEPDRTSPDQQISANFEDYTSSPTALENTLVPIHWPDFPHEFLSPGPVLLGLLVLAMAGGRSRGIGRPADLSDQRARWGYLAITALVVWASFGPSLGLYALLMDVIPGMSYLRAPCRLGVDVALGLAVVGGFGARRLVAGRVWVLVVLMIVCSVDRFAGGLNPFVGWPLAAEPIPKVYRVLATLPQGVVVDFFFPYVRNDLHRHTRPMYYSTADWMPRVNGYSDILPQDFLDLAAPINDFPALSSFPLMHRYNVRYVVWRLVDYKRDTATFDALVSRFPPAAPYIRPIYKDDEAWLYEIVAWPPEAKR